METPRPAVEGLDGRDHSATVADGCQHPGAGDGDGLRRQVLHKPFYAMGGRFMSQHLGLGDWGHADLSVNYPDNRPCH